MAAHEPHPLQHLPSSSTVTNHEVQNEAVRAAGICAGQVPPTAPRMGLVLALRGGEHQANACDTSGCLAGTAGGFTSLM